MLHISSALLFPSQDPGGWRTKPHTGVPGSTFPRPSSGSCLLWLFHARTTGKQAPRESFLNKYPGNFFIIVLFSKTFFTSNKKAQENNTG